MTNFKGRMILVYLTKAFSHSILECNSLLIAISLLTVDIISQKPPFSIFWGYLLLLLPIFIDKSKKIKPIKSTYILWNDIHFVFVIVIMEHFSAPLHTTALQVVRRKRIMERVARIELARPGRKHGILPLNYTRKKIILLGANLIYFEL